MQIHDIPEPSRTLAGSSPNSVFELEAIAANRIKAINPRPRRLPAMWIQIRLITRDIFGSAVEPIANNIHFQFRSQGVVFPKTV